MLFHALCIVYITIYNFLLRFTKKVVLHYLLKTEDDEHVPETWKYILYTLRTYTGSVLIALVQRKYILDARCPSRYIIIIYVDKIDAMIKNVISDIDAMIFS